MIETGIPNIEAQLLNLIVASIRPGAALVSAPVLGMGQVPVQLRLVIALAIGVPATALAPAVLPEGGMMSWAGAMLVASEALVGLALGFTVQIAMAAALVAGEIISNAMGLGFAAMTDPASGAASPAVGQLLSIMATLLFLATDGHLALIKVVLHSYDALPPGAAWLGPQSLYRLVEFGGLTFAAGAIIAVPVATASVIVQIILGLLSRSAPTLNIFAVSLPASLMAGIILLATAAPAMADAIMQALGEAIDQAAVLAAG